MTARRRVAWIAAAVLALLCVALAGAEASGWRFLRQPLQRALQHAAGVPVQLDGAFRAHLLWRPGLEVEHLNVGAAAGTSAPHLLDGRNVALQWRWLDAWRWRRGDALRLRMLSAKSLDVQLLRAADGRASWQIGSQRQAPSDARAASPWPTVGTLVVSDGRIAIDDRVLDTLLRVEIRGRESEGAAGEAGALDGYRGTIEGRYRALPIHLALRSGGALPLLRDDDADDDAAPAMTQLRIEGRLGGATLLYDGQAAALMGARHLDGALRFGGPSLARVGEPFGVTLPHTPAFDLLGRLAHHNGVWGLRVERATIGRSALAGDFRYDTRAEPARLSGRLQGTRLMLADLGPSIGAPTGGSPQLPTSQTPRPGAGRVLPDKKFDLPSLRAMDADVQVAIDQLVFDTDAMTPLQGLRTHLLLDRGVLELQALKAQVAGGMLSGSTQLDTRGQSARWAARLQFAGIDIAGWLRGVRTGEGERKAPSTRDGKAMRQQRNAARTQSDQPPPAYLTGELDARIDFTGSGRSTAEILSTLGGQAQVDVRDGTLSHLVTEAVGLDLAQALGVLVRGDRPLPLRCGRLDFTTRDGVMHLRRGVFDNPDSTIRVAGDVDLRSETLALVARARPKDVSPLSLRAPVSVTGTLSKPTFGIEGRRLASRVAGAVALGAVAGPLAALIPLVDTGTEQDKDPCALTNQAAGASAPKAEPPSR